MFNVKDRLSHIINNKQSILKENYGARTIKEQSEIFFSRIYGLYDMKENIFRALTSEEQINVLLVGPPATSKTLFMSTIQEQCNDVFYFDASNTTSAGLIEELYVNRKARLIIIDELDKLKRNDLNSLLGLLNDGRIVKTLKKMKYNFKMENIKVFATSNSLGNLSKPARSRFQEYHLTEYSDEEFINVVKFCLNNKIHDAISELIAKVLLNYKRKDVRSAIAISNLLKKEDTENDVLRVIENWIKYKLDEDDINYN